jgi:hypothetical protein
MRQFKGDLDAEPLAALAFKIQNDESGGQLTYVRVYTGCLRVGDSVLDATRGHLEQVGRLVRMFANHREDIRQIEAGMIGALHHGPNATIKLATGDTLCDPRHPILLDPIVVPNAVMSVLVEPETDEDVAKLDRALARLSIEDPSFRVRTDTETRRSRTGRRSPGARKARTGSCDSSAHAASTGTSSSWSNPPTAVVAMSTRIAQRRRRSRTSTRAPSRMASPRPSSAAFSQATP